MKSFKHGFTLIETMVAITVLTLSIIGPMLAADRAIVAAETTRDQLTASYLAQEGIEYVRGARDDYYLAAYHAGGSTVSASAWSSFMNSNITSCTASNPCGLGPLSGGKLQFCQSGPSGNCAPFSLLTPKGTLFTRTIQMADNGNDENITSKVSWNFHGTQYWVNISDDLTPWQ